VTDNVLLSAKFTSTQIQKVEAGQYVYDPTAQRFRVPTWTDVTSSQSAPPPAAGAWTAIRVTLSTNQPTYFMRIFGVNFMPMGATATAVHRPRDVAFVLDMTGSMGYASTFNYNGASLNPDTMVPAFGHYGLVNSSLVATTNQANGNGEALSLNNYTITTPGGPPIVRNFYFDPANVTTPASAAFPVTSNTSSLLNAFHRWSPPESGGSSTSTPPVGPTYDFTGYNAFHNGTESNPKGPTPAPDTFGTMTDSISPAITYVGDRWRRANGAVNKTDTTWAAGSTTTRGAATAAELLGYKVSGTNVQTSGGTTITTNDKFRDPVWEAGGYDLNIPAYITWRTANTGGKPATTTQYPLSAATLLAAGTAGTGLDTDRFKGYSMGPGYWGKTFFIWPPDPRWGGGTGTPDPTRPATVTVNDPAPKDVNGNYICDWRRRFFLTGSSTAWTSGSTAAVAGIDASLFRTSGSGLPLSASGFNVNYAAVLKWLKTGPQALPPNLRAGRVLYYSSIPDDVDTSTGSTQQQLDKVFWKNYIDYVLGENGYTQSANLYGYADSPTNFTRSIYTAGNLNPWTGPSGSWTGSAAGTGAITPYLAYTDSPLRPRLHFWFGPLSMMDFIANGLANKNGGYVNWNPGTCYEAQCWQLKTGVNSVITAVQGNHPNDLIAMTMFAYNSSAPPTIYQNPRVGIGQNYTAMRNALFYPKSLLTAINGGDQTTELRPYDTSFTSCAPDEIPNANGGTDPNTGLAIAFNLLSPSTSLSTSVYGSTRGRRGASKVVIFETDGVPNSHTTYTFNQLGYNSYYSGFANGGSDGNGAAAAMNPAVAVAQQIVKPMLRATSGDSGLSLPNAPARVYPIAFGDLFDPVASPGATFRPTALQFLANVAAAGNTGTSGATTLPSNQIITGSYDQRISRLTDCMERIFQSGVAVTLIE
jgi:hypothetical protein